MGYIVYRTVLEYYSGDPDEDAYGKFIKQVKQLRSSREEWWMCKNFELERIEFLTFEHCLIEGVNIILT